MFGIVKRALLCIVLIKNSKDIRQDGKSNYTWARDSTGRVVCAGEQLGMRFEVCIVLITDVIIDDMDVVIEYALQPLTSRARQVLIAARVTQGLSTPQISATLARVKSQNLTRCLGLATLGAVPQTPVCRIKYKSRQNVFVTSWIWTFNLKCNVQALNTGIICFSQLQDFYLSIWCRREFIVCFLGSLSFFFTICEQFVSFHECPAFLGERYSTSKYIKKNTPWNKKNCMSDASIPKFKTNIKQKNQSFGSTTQSTELLDLELIQDTCES